MVSTQDFAHEVWQSLENIRERLAVLETEVRHTRHDLMRLENGLVSHTTEHHPPLNGGPKAGRSSGDNGGDGNGATINIRISRRWGAAGWWEEDWWPVWQPPGKRWGGGDSACPAW